MRFTDLPPKMQRRLGRVSIELAAEGYLLDVRAPDVWVFRNGGSSAVVRTVSPLCPTLEVTFWTCRGVDRTNPLHWGDGVVESGRFRVRRTEGVAGPYLATKGLRAIARAALEAQLASDQAVR